MADVAHEASGPASPEPGHIQRVKPASADSGKLHVFISYSRDDLSFADQLDAALSACGFDCLIDRHGISGGEDWKRRLGNLISEADTVVFVLSPSSARSPICDWEVEEAARLNKRILPVNCRPLEDTSAPPLLRELNYIFFYEEPKLPGSGFGTGLASLVAALNTDFDWLREHTRYLQRAIEWNTRGRPANRLLSGDDIAEAKAWAARQPQDAPEPTSLHFDYIRASEEEADARLSEQRKQLEEIAAAQAGREKALHKAEEALKQAADEQQKRLREHRKRARNRNIALIIVSISAVVSWLFGYLAVTNGRVANDTMDAAVKIIVELQPQMSVDTQKQLVAVFRAAANNGNAVAMSRLGWLYGQGFGVTKDYVKSREWYEKASSWPAENEDAMNNLGTLYQNGFGVAQDYAKAREWYEKAAAKGNAHAMNNLGALYDVGLGVATDYGKAREWFEKAAEKGNADAMYNLAQYYNIGRGMAQDYDKARDWFEKAAEKGNADAMYELGLLHVNEHGIAQDYAKARDWFEKAAEKGNAQAMYNLGLLYDNGLGGPQDYAKAREWYEKSAVAGNAYAMNNFGVLYENGRGVAKDYGKAREWYEKSAVAGDADAMNSVGMLYLVGRGVAKDYASARDWYERAAAQGNANAMNNLGALYQNGFGVAQDYAKAREWYEKAAAKGDASAKLALERLPIR
jgi:TPR repeat protein